MFTDNYDSSFCFWVFEKRLTQENCFHFRKKYALFNWLMLGGGGGGGTQDLSISYLKQNCFSHGEGSFKESIHKQFYSK